MQPLQARTAPQAYDSSGREELARWSSRSCPPTPTSSSRRTCGPRACRRRFRDRAPHLEHEYNGQTGDFLVCEPLRPFNPTSLGCAGIPPEELEQFARGGYAVCRPGSWDPVERLKDMDVDGLGAEIFYCGYGMSLFSHPDDEFQRDAHRAYNDWAAEYASHAPEAPVPDRQHLDDRSRADLSELYRVKKLGLPRHLRLQRPAAPSGATTTRCGTRSGRAVEEYDLPVNVHILTRQGGPQVGANPIVDGVVLPVPAFRTIAEMITGGVFDKHPRLKIISRRKRHRLDAELPQAPGVVLVSLRPALSHSSRRTPPTSGAARCTPPSRTTCPAFAAAT